MRENPPILCDFISVHCPCKIIDLKREIVICDFASNYAALDIAGDSRRIKILLSKVCAEVRNERLHHESIVSRNKELARKFLDEVKIGDKVFCTADINDVLFIEFPSNKSRLCKYKASDGFIGQAPAFAFRLISKGIEHVRYETKDNKKAVECARFAKRYGFRVEEHEVKDKYIIDIYGDNKEEIKEYITNFSNNLVFNSLEDF